MRRLNEFATTHAKPINIDVQIIENTFELIMQGKKEQYVNELSNYIKGLLISNQNKIVSVAQLSMVETAEKIECEMDVKIGNPLKTLVTHIESSLQGLFS
jgi:CO dehydrogenase/acetyl-CoA synthase beta subunit